MNERDDDLALRLRGLPREAIPPARVWAAVAERVSREPRPSPRATTAGQRRRRWPALAGFAAAAVLALAIAIPLFPVSVPGPAPEDATPEPQLVRQADQMAGEYRQALAALPRAQVSGELQPALDELDRSAAAIHSAIREAPSAYFLIDQLQRTYARRLELTRRTALGAAALL